MLRNYLAATVMAIAAGGAQGDTLDFSEVGAVGLLGTTSFSVSNAEVTGFGTDLFLGEIDGAAGLDLCAINGNTCQADLEIDFADTVENLTFSIGSWVSADFVSISIFGADDASQIGTFDITSADPVDLTGFGQIGRLFFDDQSNGAGIGYSGFSFDTVAPVAPVPGPAGLPMLLSAMAAAGLVRRRRR